MKIFWHNQNYCILLTFQLHQENRKKGKKREKSVDEDDEEVKRDKLKKVQGLHSYITLDIKIVTFDCSTKGMNLCMLPPCQ